MSSGKIRDWRRAGVWCGLVLLGLLGTACRLRDGTVESVPERVDCASFCGRTARCLVSLCNDDTDSKAFDPALSALRDDCLATCSTDQLVALGGRGWSCLFENGCRDVFEADVCEQEASYTCGSTGGTNCPSGWTPEGGRCVRTTPGAGYMGACATIVDCGCHSPTTGDDHFCADAGAEPMDCFTDAGEYRCSFRCSTDAECDRMVQPDSHCNGAGHCEIW